MTSSIPTTEFQIDFRRDCLALGRSRTGRIDMMTSHNGNGDDADTGTGARDNLVHFPATDAERRAMRKLQQDRERQRLVNVFVDEDRALFRDLSGTAYADLIIEGHRETWPIKSKQFRSAYIGYLRRQLDGLVAGGSALALMVKASMTKNAVNATINDFEIRACSSTSPVRPVHVRVAEHEGDIYIDLCDPTWCAIRIGAAGWHVVETPPVRFRRSVGMLPLPPPMRGGQLAALRPFLNVVTDADFILIVGWLLSALRPSGPYPILNLYGEHGTAKTHLLRVLRGFSDPHVTATTRLPFSSRDLFIAARNSHVQMFSNVSAISEAMSDDLCRLATEGGARLRALFTDSDEVLFSGNRPIAIEGIARTVIRPDLLDRSLVIVTEPLSRFMPEREFWPRLESECGRIFGALLDAMVRGLAALPTTWLVNKPPRMADFALWSVACGLDQFEAAYTANRQASIDVMLEHDPLARAVRAFMAGRRQWRGAAKDLLAAIGPAAGIKSTQAIADELRRLAPALRTVGLNVVSEQRTGPLRPLRIEWTR
jgi:hypothetical protein